VADWPLAMATMTHGENITRTASSFLTAQIPN
jgi:hypothetical protein